LGRIGNSRIAVAISTFCADGNGKMNIGRTVTFIPGAAGLGSFWAPIAERLPATWRTHLVDLPGLGPVPPDPAVSSYADLVEYVARRTNVPAVLVGQSMGGFIALQLALRHPHLVTHLALVAVTGGVDMASHGAHDWRQDYVATHPSAPLWARAPVPDLTEELSTIEIPTLLVWATRDALSPLGVAHTLASRIRTTSLVTFESDDHWVARTHADETAAALRAFVEAGRVTMLSGV
jgi:pimeloyl-ACP methyl ester carboxylesterase